MKNIKAILIVDDEAIIIESLKRELISQYGDRYLFETALDAEEADGVIDEMSTEGARLILVISDWLMPGLKGDEFLAKVKKRHPHIRCIIISGQADPEAVESARKRVDLDAFIRKPWTHRTLIDAVDACVGNWGSAAAGV